MKQFLLTSIVFINSALVFSQNTIGLLSYDPTKAQDGYLFLYPQNQGTAFLINNCGEVVHQWIDDPTGPANGATLAADGSVFMAKKDYNYTNTWMFGGGAGQKIEHRDWDNNLLWQFQYADSTKRMHHSFDVLPNGNVVLIAWERRSIDACIAAGKDTSMLISTELWPDHLVEIQPIGLDSGTVVWEWHVWDHLIQDFDNTKPNFGVVSEHPELINLNYTNDNTDADWIHFNSVNYNPVLDQLIVSTPTLNEVWIIDHSTTTAEAAGHTGGLCGKGGDLIYRWGNPAAYNQGTVADKKLGFQHDVHWTDFELPANHPDKGKLMVFNNNYQQNVSAAVTFTPVFDTLYHTYLMQNNTYLPTDFDYVYTAPIASDIYCAVVSSAQRLPNGNTLICSGRKGYTREVTSLNEIVWEYKTPINNSVPAVQGSTIPIGGNFTFRSKKYSSDWPGFVGRNLDPLGYIELNPDTTFCSTILGIGTIDFNGLHIAPNPTNGIVQLSSLPQDFKGTMFVSNLSGQVLLQQKITESNVVTLDLSAFQSGTYLINLFNDSGSSSKTRIVKN
jgi:hypothetical protein